MAQETPRPKRGRRRWIIAGVLLFVVAVACWWYWPRRDARFVGKWRITAPGENGSHRVADIRIGRWDEFYKDQKRSAYVWWMDDMGRIVLNDSPVTIDEWLKSLQKSILRAFGSHYAFEQDVLIIKSVEADRFEFVNVLLHHGEVMTATRIPE